ncbi:hypothetical protein HZC21_01095 [Candidatus Peregrinibacteria bacterium]|nr:hypothetical protein [Candidatus Peregrinibacteria bacterium]
MDRYVQRFGDINFKIPKGSAINDEDIVLFLEKSGECSIVWARIENNVLEVRVAADYEELQTIVEKTRELLKGAGISIRAKVI